MNRTQMFKVVLVALLVGGGLAYATYNYLDSVPVRTVEVPTRPVVVSQADLQLGAELKPSDFRVVEWPVSSVPAGAFDDTSELTGRGLVRSVAMHEPFLPSKLAAVGAGAGLPPSSPW